MSNRSLPPASISRRLWLAASLASLGSALSACGGSGGSFDLLAGVGTGGTGSFSTGAIRGFGSIIVNNVRYDDTSARVVSDEGTALSNTQLRLGMVVDVDGSDITTDAAGLRRASASSIQVRSEILGPIERVDAVAGTLTVLGQAVRTTAATVVDETLRGGLAGLSPGQTVVIYGERDRAGVCTASRIELRTGAPSYHLRGPIGTVDGTARRLRMGDAVLFYGDAQRSGDLDQPRQGAFARVDLALAPGAAGVWRATRLELRNAPLAGVLPSDKAQLELEGFITAFTSRTQFSVNGVAVDASNAQGVPADLALNQHVEVKGQLANGVLIAREVEREDDKDRDGSGFEVEGRITQIDRATATLVVRGLVVRYANARFKDGRIDQLREGLKVDIKGRLASDGVRLDADEIELKD
ncbi:MAG: DUF5666 domain-containing protein [Burkholderiaceae bacterium]|nr:DUF5666 domain-containing protein [Burkholderiaceae bacterium]